MLKIYITDLGAYNSGYLVGEYVELPQDEDVLKEEIQNILKKGQEVCLNLDEHEEFFITDYIWDNIPVFEVDKYDNIFDLNEKIMLLSTLDDEKLKAVKFLFEDGYANDIEEAIEKSDEVYIYENQTMKDVAYNYIDQCYDISNLPSLITSNIDYKGIGEDLRMDGCFVEIDSDIYEYNY